MPASLFSDSGTVDQAFSLQQGGLSWPGLAAKHLGRLQKRNLVSSPWGGAMGWGGVSMQKEDCKLGQRLYVEE